MPEKVILILLNKVDLVPRDVLAKVPLHSLRDA